MWYDNLCGIQYKGDNAKDIVAFLDTPATIINTKNGPAIIAIETQRGEVLVRKGDWVARDTHGRDRIIRIEEVKNKKSVSPADLAK